MPELLYRTSSSRQSKKVGGILAFTKDEEHKKYI